MKVLNPSGLVLQIAQAHQVIDLVLGLLDVAVEHRAVGVDPHLMRRAVYLEPLVGVELAVADDLADFGSKISAPPPGSEPSPASRIRSSTSAIEIFSSLANQPISIAVNALRWTLGKRSFKPAQHLQVPVEREVGVKTADDVELGHRVAALLAPRARRPPRATSPRRGLRP